MEGLRIGLFLIHAAVIGYVCSGWMVSSREGLLTYLVLLPLIMLQWILNGGSSVVSNLENYSRTGRWRDPNGGLEGQFFRSVLRPVGIDASQAQINTVIVVAMLIFWLVALFRMMLTVPVAPV